MKSVSRKEKTTFGQGTAKGETEVFCESEGTYDPAEVDGVSEEEEKDEVRTTRLNEACSRNPAEFSNLLHLKTISSRDKYDLDEGVALFLPLSQNTNENCGVQSNAISMESCHKKDYLSKISDEQVLLDWLDNSFNELFSIWDKIPPVSDKAEFVGKSSQSCDIDLLDDYTEAICETELLFQSLIGSTAKTCEKSQTPAFSDENRKSSNPSLSASKKNECLQNHSRGVVFILGPLVLFTLIGIRRSWVTSYSS